MAHRTRFVRLCLGYVRAKGVDPATLIEACGLPADAATAETTELSLQRLAEFADRAADLLGDADLGIHLAAFSQRGDYGIGEYVAVASPTVGGAVRPWRGTTDCSTPRASGPSS